MPTHQAHPDFWRCYRSLPRAAQKLADEAFERLKQNPRHPSLQFKRVENFWSARVGREHRVLGLDTPQGITWFWIGLHDEYERLIRHG